MGSVTVGHDWATSLSLFTCMHWRRKWQPTPVFLPGESQGRRSLVGCRLWGCTVGHDWSDLAAKIDGKLSVKKKKKDWWYDRRHCWNSKMVLGGYCEDGHGTWQDKERRWRRRKNQGWGERKEGKWDGGRKEKRKASTKFREWMSRKRHLETVYRYLRKYNLSQCFPVRIVTLQFSYLNFKVVWLQHLTL